MNVNMDYSFLFSNMSGTSGMTGTSSSGSMYLSDYASIKNGSYLKLMKAYYAKNDAAKENGGLASNSTSKDTTKTLAAIQADTDALQESADALMTKGSKSLFKQKEITSENEDGTKTTKMGYDMDAIYKGVKSFVEDYNSLINSAADSNSNSILRQTLNLTKTTSAYGKLLGNAGITIGSGNKLSVDEETFRKADISTVKSLFNGNSSYAYNIAAKASMINISADSEASKAGTYNGMGGFNNPYSMGNIYNSYF